MDKYETIKNRSDGDFKRLTVVTKATFIKMVEVVVKYENARKKILGRPLKLSYANQILMTLEYLRYHIAVNYGVSEAIIE